MAVTAGGLKLASKLLDPGILAVAVGAILFAPSSALVAPLRARITLSSETLRLILGGLIGVKALSLANEFLNRVAHRNWSLRPHAGWDWPGELAVVPGGSGAIGVAIVEGLASHGIRVGILDINPPPEGRFPDNDRVAYFRCDLGDHDSVLAAAGSVRAHFGGASPSILVNSAGVGGSMSILDSTLAQRERTIRINLLSHWSTVQAFLPDMIVANKGHIVTVASVASFMPMTHSSAYSSAKAGLMGFHDTLTQEIRHIYLAPGVLTTIVHPSWVDTSMIAEFGSDVEKAHGRLLTVADVAGPVVDQILARRGGALIVPQFLGFMAGMRGWPAWLADAVRDVINVSVIKVKKRRTGQ